MAFIKFKTLLQEIKIVPTLSNLNQFKIGNYYDIWSSIEKDFKKIRFEGITKKGDYKFIEGAVGQVLIHPVPMAKMIENQLVRYSSK